VVPSEDAIPGVATWYATTCLECPAGCGLTVRTREGRATKVEGNPEHPVNRGGLCVRGQASLQGLYNPDRVREPLQRSGDGNLRPLTWDEAETQLAGRIRTLLDAGESHKIVFLSGRSSDSLSRLTRQWMRALHSEAHHVYEPFSYSAIQAANRITFGRSEIPYYDIPQADYVLSFGADFLETWLSPVGFARDFAQMHAYRGGKMGKLVQIEPRLSLTGANADEWVAVKPGTEMFLALGMANRILLQGAETFSGTAEGRRLRELLSPYAVDFVRAQTGIPGETIERLATEFADAEAGLALGGGIAGSNENATGTLVAINLLNYIAGRVGQTIRFDRPFSTGDLAGRSELTALVDSMNRNEVALLFLHHTNPLFTLPPALGFRDAIQKVPLVVNFSSFPDETSEFADLLLPDHTPLEQWGDHQPLLGVHSLIQPAMNPVFETRATGDVLLEVARLVGGEVGAQFPWQNYQDYLKTNWKETYAPLASEDFESFWRDTLRRGGVWTEFAGSLTEEAAKREPKPSLAPQVFDFAFREARFEGAGEFFLHLYPSSRFYDGRGANRPWLQEIPDPVTNIVWDSWVELHPETARRLDVAEGDILLVESPVGRLEAPAYLYEGVRPDTVAIPIGQGHESYGRYAQGRGANAITLLPAAWDPVSQGQAWSCTKVQIAKTGRKSALVRTDGSLKELDRGFSKIVPLSVLTLGENRSATEATAHAAQEPEPPSMYPPHEHKIYRWGMAINLSSCIGCQGCVAACYAENNIPVVGKEQVARGRHMAWIRIERYLETVSPTPDVRFSPMMCQQCDNAPCEPVCPVYATMHNSEGLNVQVYNRCVGTRYCSNNCPYKVRAFNWFTYEFPDPLPLQLNPDVSVRSKGIMEKCTFCIQRIREGKDRAKDEGRLVRDGEVVPACAQSCPTQAIVFGNLLDPESAVSRLSRAEHGYHALEELNTRPAIAYLPRVRRS
jgi:molybdopterin-containing oxidoreductase family iron-sulfur binding subunit